MTRRLIVRPQASRELAAAMEWYENQRSGLGQEFVRAFQVAVNSIAQNPLQYQMFGPKARRVGLRGFPYGLIYSVSDDEILVLACFHGKRDPRRWLE